MGECATKGDNRVGAPPPERDKPTLQLTDYGTPSRTASPASNATTDAFHIGGRSGRRSDACLSSRMISEAFASSSASRVANVCRKACNCAACGTRSVTPARRDLRIRRELQVSEGSSPVSPGAASAGCVGDDVSVTGVGLRVATVRIGDVPHRPPGRMTNLMTARVGDRDRQSFDRRWLVRHQQDQTVTGKFAEHLPQPRRGVDQRGVLQPSAIRRHRGQPSHAARATRRTADRSPLLSRGPYAVLWRKLA